MNKSVGFRVVILSACNSIRPRPWSLQSSAWTMAKYTHTHTSLAMYTIWLAPSRYAAWHGCMQDCIHMYMAGREISNNSNSSEVGHNCYNATTETVFVFIGG